LLTAANAAANDAINRGKIIFKPILLAALAALATLTAGTGHAQSVADGQSKADYLAWLAQSPENREEVRSFREFLAENRVEDVVPVWQLVRTSSRFSADWASQAR